MRWTPGYILCVCRYPTENLSFLQAGLIAFLFDPKASVKTGKLSDDRLGNSGATTFLSAQQPQKPHTCGTRSCPTCMDLICSCGDSPGLDVQISHGDIGRKMLNEPVGVTQLQLDSEAAMLEVDGAQHSCPLHRT